MTHQEKLCKHPCSSSRQAQCVTRNFLLECSSADHMIVRWHPPQEMLSYFSCNGYLNKFQEKINVSIDEDPNLLYADIEGLDASLKKVFKNVTEIAVDLVELGRRVNSLFAECFQAIQKSYIAEKLASEEIKVGWSLESECLLVCGASDEEISKAFDILESLVGMLSFSVEFSNNSQQPIWRSHMRRLKHNFGGKIFYAEVKDEVCLATPTDLINDVLEALKERVDCPATVSEFVVQVPLTEFQLQLVKCNGTLLNNRRIKIRNDQQHHVNVKLEDNLCILKTGSLSYLYHIKEDLLKFLSSEIYIENIVPIANYDREWFKSKSCVIKLEENDLLFGTVSCIQIYSSTDTVEIPAKVDVKDYSIGWLLANEQQLHLFQTALAKLTLYQCNYLAERVFLVEAMIDALYIPTCRCCGAATEFLLPNDSRSSLVDVYKDTCDLEAATFTEIFPAMITTALRKMQKSKKVAIVIPVCLLYPHVLRGDIAEIVIGAALNFLSSSSCSLIQQVGLIIPSFPGTLYQTFGDMMKKVKAGGSQTQENKLTHVRIHVRGLSEEVVKEAIMRFQHEVNQMMMTVDWSSSPYQHAIANLSKQEVKEIGEKAEENHLAIGINLEERQIIVKGLRADVECIREYVNSILASMFPVEVSVPSSWSLREHFHEVLVDPQSQEYRAIITKTGWTEDNGILSINNSSHHKIRLEEVVRVQNKYLYVQFEARKSTVMNECSQMHYTDSPVEMELWHGTRGNSAASICSSEFNRCYAKPGMDNSKGIYFAEDFSSSWEISLQASRESSDTLVYIMLAKVLTGRPHTTSEHLAWPQVTQFGCHSLRIPKENSEYFDYVIYHDSAAYPQYVIKASIVR